MCVWRGGGGFGKQGRLERKSRVYCIYCYRSARGFVYFVRDPFASEEIVVVLSTAPSGCLAFSDAWPSPLLRILGLLPWTKKATHKANNMSGFDAKSDMEKV
jgi:hypothetical protein